MNKKIAFFGTPAFTVEFLENFKKNGINVSLIVTGEDKPVGRGQNMQSPKPKIFGYENHIQVMQPKKLDEEFYNEISKESWDLFIVIAYGKIIPEKIINFPKHGTINLHYSLLPSYRGASPVETAILNGDEKTGITIQQMKYELDSGDILFQEEMEISKDETASELRDKMNKKSQEIFTKFLSDFFDGKITSIKQDENKVTKCGKFKKEDLDVTEEIESNNLSSIHTKYRAYDKKIFFFHNLGDKQLRVKITEMSGEEISKLLPESKKEISLRDFENSYGKIF